MLKLRVTPESAAIGAAIIMLAATPQIEVEVPSLWNGVSNAIATNWQAVLILIRSIATGLVSAYVMGAPMSDFSSGSPILICLTYTMVVLVLVLIVSAARAAKMGSPSDSQQQKNER